MLPPNLILQHVKGILFGHYDKLTSRKNFLPELSSFWLIWPFQTKTLTYS